MKGARPFVLVNVAMTADGKIALASGKFEPFGSKYDREHMMELRATADAVMAGARTVDSCPMTLGAGGEKYRKRRLSRGLSEENLRVIVSGAGTVDPAAKIFQKRISPIIILTTGRAPAARLRRLRALADEVKVCGETELDFGAALRWLGTRWGVKRLLCEGGGALNAGLFERGLVDEVHLTICPRLLGGRTGPTLADGVGVEKLAEARRWRLQSIKKAEDDLFLVYRIAG